MADTPQRDPRIDNEETAEGAKPSRRKLAELAEKFLKRKWLGIVLGFAVVIPAVGISCYRLGIRAVGNTPNAEVSLGDFRFAVDRPAPGQVAEARFALHLALIDEVNRAARGRLQARAFRVEQDIEELLRRAHGTDFDDPALAELKRQLQEQINRTLELRAIADVIITNLQLEREPEGPASVAGTTEPLPWGEPSAG